MRALFAKEEGQNGRTDDLIGSGKRGFVTVQDRRRDLPGKAEIGFVSTVSRNQISGAVFPFEEQIMNTGIHLQNTEHIWREASSSPHNTGNNSVKMFNYKRDTW